MAEDLLTNLQAYKLQIQQVEAALTTEPGNEDLLKLQKDLTEVIELTRELIKNQGGGDCSGSAATAAAAAPVPVDGKASTVWKIGDKCMALTTASGHYFEGKIVDITEDEQCTISFDMFDTTEVTTLSMLKPALKKKRPFPDPGISSESNFASKKQVVKQQREYKKKKQQKKQQRMKVMEEEREVEKGKWHDFNSKAFNKNKKGHVKKSIFATPDNINGRVGVGTCGIGGKPMTEYHHQEKWRKNSQ